MGAEVGVLSNYTLHAPFSQQDDAHLWSLFSATSQDHPRPLSVFVHERSSDKEAKFAENCIKCIRLMRHPHIVKYVTSSGSPATDLQLVVEFVQPVLMVSNDMHSMEVIAGLRGVVEALDFLHVKCQMSHNNVCAANVMVAGKDRAWRLSGFDVASLFSAITGEYLKEIEPFREAEAIPPEDKNRSSGPVDSHCPHARDAWALGSLICEFSEHLNGHAPGELETRLGDTLLSQSPEDRPTMKAQLADSLLSNQLVKIMLFIDSITLKSAKEKSAFFRSLPRRLQQVPPELVARHLARKLLSRFVLMEEAACSQVVPFLLTPKRESDVSVDCSGFFDGGLFKAHIVPILLKLFLAEDKHVRLALLHHLPSFSDHFSQSSLKEDVLPQVLLGMHDSDDEIVAMTFEALAHLVRVLGATAVVGSSARVSHFTGVSPQPQSGNGQVFRSVSIATAGSATPRSGTSASKSQRQPQAKLQLHTTPLGASRLPRDESPDLVCRQELTRPMEAVGLELSVEEAHVAGSIRESLVVEAEQADDQTTIAEKRVDAVAMGGHRGRKSSALADHTKDLYAPDNGNVDAGKDGTVDDEDVVAEDDDNDWEGFDDSWTESNAGDQNASLQSGGQCLSENFEKSLDMSESMWNGMAENKRTVRGHSEQLNVGTSKGVKLTSLSKQSGNVLNEDVKGPSSTVSLNQKVIPEQAPLTAEEALLAELEPTIQFGASSSTSGKQTAVQKSAQADTRTPTKTTVSLDYVGATDGDAEGWGEDDFEDF